MRSGIDYRNPLPLNETGQAVITVGSGLAMVLVLALAVRHWRRAGSPVPLLILVGAGLALVNEPVVNLTGNVHHHEIGQWTVFTLYGRDMPAWGLPGYVLVYGAMALLIAWAIERGFTRRAVLGVVGLACLFQTGLEQVILPLDMYSYYGPAPFKLNGMPMYWLAINFAGTTATAAILVLGRQWLRGWRQLWLLALPATTQIVCSTLIALPVFGLLDTDAPTAVIWMGGAMCFVLGALFIDAMVRLAIRGRSEEEARRGAFAVADRRPDRLRGNDGGWRSSVRRQPLSYTDR